MSMLIFEAGFSLSNSLEKQKAEQWFSQRLSSAEDEVVALLFAQCFFRQFRGPRPPPYSYILNGLTQFVFFLRENVKEGPGRSVSEFEDKLEEFWRIKFSNILHFAHANTRKDNIDVEYSAKEQLDLRTVLVPNVDHWYCTVQGKERYTFGEADSEGAPVSHTREAKMSHNFVSFIHAEGGFDPDNRVRINFLRAVGVSPAEAKSREDHNVIGPLDELRASHLVAGPFQISLTRAAVEHLTFDETHGKPTLRVLHLDRVIDYYIAQRSGLSTY
jgi:hypothetical protein